MKKYLLLVVLALLLVNCQREIHWDLPSHGSILKDDTGNCLPVTVSGVYYQDSVTKATNFIIVDVNVTSIGTYSIYTDSVNGIKFSASGGFTGRGVHHVKLLCTGTPQHADTSFFSIYYDASVCGAMIIAKSNAVPPAKFSLQASPGNCLNDTVAGAFIKGAGLDSSDKVNIHVNVLSPGRYIITTNTVNGYSLSASGIFETAGVQTITLYPKGIPGNTGTDTFKITADSSTCRLLVNVRSDEAQFTLNDSAGKCMYDTVTGTYVKGITLDDISRISIRVNVNSPGKYALTTNTVNGYSFTGAGVLETTGEQIITLYARGRPENAGTDIFTVTAGATACSFSVIVLPGLVSVTGNDLIPLTDGSYWIYDDLFTRGNTIKRSITGDSSSNGNIYKVLQQTDGYDTGAQSLFRKNNDKYYEYAREDKYTNSFQYAKSIYTDLLFAGQYLLQNETWESPEFSDMATFNQVIALKYMYKCLKTNAVVTINGKAFADVCIIEMRPFIRALNNPWGPTNEIYTWYYAKGIGLIYYNAVSNLGYRKAEMQLSTWQVN